MRINNLTISRPVNKFSEALQNYCHALVADPAINGIPDLDTLKIKIWEYAETISTDFPRCKLYDLESEVHTYLTFGVYNLIYKGETNLISIVARPDTYKAAFNDYDKDKAHIKIRGKITGIPVGWE